VNHWTEGEEAYGADYALIRPYTITHGRTSAGGVDLTLITVVTTVEPVGGQPGARGLEPEHQFILQRCRRPAAVAEVAAGLNLPISVTKILIGDLVALGRVTAKPPVAVAHGSALDITLLQAVRDGLRRL
jgi:hypothetical protein